MKLINWECLKEMDKLIAEWVKVDAIITDPPYNISRETNFHTMKWNRWTSMDFWEWDKWFDITWYIYTISRIIKQWWNIVMFNDWKNLWDIVKFFEINWIEPKRCLVLNKSNPVPFNRDRMFVNDVEFAIWGVYKPKWKNKWTFNREEKFEKCVMNTQLQSKKFHPTMKDEKIISKLVRLLTNKWDIVLDPFMGSWTTWLACKNLDRDFIWIELDENYFKIAKERINKEENIIKLF